MLSEATAYGLKFRFPAGDTAVGPCLRDYGEFARVIPAFLLDHAEGKGAFIDVGANIGSICLPFATNRLSWRVIAVEGHGGLAKILAENVAANGVPNIETRHAAVGDRSGMVDFPHPPLDGAFNFGEIGFGRPATVFAPTQMVTLDEIATPETRLIKVDVEGFEPEVLDGARELLASHRAVWLIEAAVQFPKETAETIRRLQAAGYSVFWFFAPFVTPKSRGGNPPDPSLGDANIVALPRGAPNRWNLTPVGHPDEMRPQNVRAYPYLVRYGYPGP